MRRIVLTLTISTIILAACGSSTSSTSSTTSASSTSSTSRSAPTPSTSSAALVVTANNPRFRASILVDSGGRTLYTHSKAANPVACSGTCEATWPPLLLARGTTTPVAGPGISGLARFSPTGQAVSYMGFPLFRYSGDKAPGEALGDGITSFGGTWHVVELGSNPATA